jgi:ATP-dependent Clp protease adapter protein ClpS
MATLSLPMYNIIVFDDPYHTKADVELLLEQQCQLTPAEAKRATAAIDETGKAIVKTIWYEAAEHYHAQLKKLSAACDIEGKNRALYVEIKEVR